MLESIYIIVIIIGILISFSNILTFIESLKYLVEYFDPIQLNDESREKCIQYYCFKNNCMRPTNLNQLFIKIEKRRGTNNFVLYLDILFIDYISQFDFYCMDFKIYMHNIICKKNYYCYLFSIFLIKFAFIIVAIPFGNIIFVSWIIYKFFNILWRILKFLSSVCFIRNSPSVFENNNVQDNLKPIKNQEVIVIDIQPIDELPENYSQENLPIAYPALDKY